MSRVVGVVFGAVLIHLFDHTAKLTVGEMLMLVGFLTASCKLGGFVGVNKQAGRLIFTENIVTAAANDHAVGSLCHFTQDVRLLGIDRGILLEEIVTTRGMKGAPDGDGEENPRFLLYDLLNVVFGKLGTLGNFGNDLLIVVGDAEQVGKSFSKLASAASKFTSDGNDFVHNSSSIAVCGVFLFLLYSFFCMLSRKKCTQAQILPDSTVFY